MKNVFNKADYLKMRRFVRFVFLILPISIFPQLSGIYTIPSVTYPTISSIVADLNTNGVSGPVEIKILAGTYTENISLAAINGTSTTNTVTFQPNSGIVIIQYAPTNPNIDNFVLQFDGTQHIVINNLTFTTLGSTYARVVSLKNSAGNLIFEDNLFNGYTGLNTNNFQSVVFW